MGADLTPDERSKGLAFANELLELAMRAPDIFIESRAHAFVHVIRKRYGYSKPLKRAEILKRLGRGGLTIGEIQRATGFHKDDVYSIVKDLEAEGEVVCRRIPPAGDRGGRPTLCVFIAGKQP